MTRIKDLWRRERIVRRGCSARGLATCLGVMSCLIPLAPEVLGLETINLAIQTKSFQQVIYPIAQDRGYMREEGIDLKSSLSNRRPSSKHWLLEVPILPRPVPAP